MSETCQVAFVPHFTFFKVRSPRHVCAMPCSPMSCCLSIAGSLTQCACILGAISQVKPGGRNVALQANQSDEDRSSCSCTFDQGPHCFMGCTTENDWMSWCQLWGPEGLVEGFGGQAVGGQIFQQVAEASFSRQTNCWAGWRIELQQLCHRCIRFTAPCIPDSVHSKTALRSYRMLKVTAWQQPVYADAPKMAYLQSMFSPVTEFVLQQRWSEPLMDLLKSSKICGSPSKSCGFENFIAYTSLSTCCGGCTKFNGACAACLPKSCSLMQTGCELCQVNTLIPKADKGSLRLPWQNSTSSSTLHVLQMHSRSKPHRNCN